MAKDVDNKGRAALVAWMQAAGATQADIARRLDVPQATVSRWIACDNRPGLEAALALEDLTFGAVRAGLWVGR